MRSWAISFGERPRGFFLRIFFPPCTAHFGRPSISSEALPPEVSAPKTWSACINRDAASRCGPESSTSGPSIGRPSAAWSIKSAAAAVSATIAESTTSTTFAPPKSEKVRRSAKIGPRRGGRRRVSTEHPAFPATASASRMACGSAATRSPPTR
ncbi:MAG: hypothetical protein AAGF23_14065 [Acidobacteriota bacterium]